MAKLSFKVDANWQEVQRLRDEITKLKQELKNTDAMQAPAAFNTLNNKLQQTSFKLRELKSNIVQASASMESDFKQKIFAASQSVNGYTEKIIAQKAVVKDIANDVKKLGDAYRDAAKTSPMMAADKLSEWRAAKNALEEEKASLFALTQEQATARLSVKKLRDEYALFRQDGGGTAQTMDLLTSKMKNMGATILGGMGLKELASNIISVRSEFESLETSLKVLLGGDQSRLDNIMKQVKDYALASPLNTKDMVGAVQMMASFGIEAEKSIDYLKAMGDISMGDTNKFNSLTLAFSQMSSAGKLMGQDLLQMINAGFNPLEEISRKTGKSIGELKEEMSKGAISSKMVQDAFISATSAGGKFFGMSSEGAKNLRGQMSMLQENLDLMFNEWGEKTEGVTMTSIQGLTKLVENYEQVGRVLLGLIETYGAYRVGLALATFAENGHTVAMSLARVQILLTQKAQAFLNATMLSNPYVLAATALGVLVGTLIATSDGLTTAERAQKSFNESIKEAEEAQQKYNQETENAINLATSDGTATNDRRKAMNLLIDRYPSIIKKYMDEAGWLRNIVGLKREIAAIDGNGAISASSGKAADARRAAEGLKLQKEAEAKAINAGMSKHEFKNFLTKEQLRQVRWANTWYEKNNKNYSFFRQGSTEDRLAFAKSYTVEADKNTEKLIKDKRMDKFQDAIGKMSDKRLDTLRKTLQNAKHIKKNVILQYKELNGASLTHEDINKLLTYAEGVYSARNKKAKGTTKKDLDEQKKNLQAQLDALTEIEAKGKKGAELKRKIAELNKREEAYSTSTKKDKTAEKEANKAKHEAEKAREENKKLVEEAKKSVRDNNAALLDDGKTKQLEEIKNKYVKTIETIDEHIKKYRENAKTLKESVADVEKGLKPFEQLKAQALEEYDKSIKKLAEQDMQSLYSYLEKYGTIQEKKYAIYKEYADKIAKAQNEYDKKSLANERDNKISALNVQDIKQSIDWGGLFSQSGIILREQLEPTIKKLVDITKSEDFKKEDYASQKVVYDLIEKLRKFNEGFDKDMFKKVAANLEQYNKALADYNNAVAIEQKAFKDLERAQKHYGEATKESEKEIISKTELEPAKTALKEASANVVKFQDKLTQAGQGVNDAAADAATQLRSMGNAISGLASGSIKGIGEALAQIDRLLNGGKVTKAIADGFIKLLSGTKLGKKVADTLATALGQNGGLAAQIVSLILSLLDVLAKQGVGGIVASLIESIIDAIAGIIDNILSGKFIEQIVKAIINGIGKILNAVIGNLGRLLTGGLLSNNVSDWFNGSNSKEVTKATDRLTKVNERLIKSVDHLKDEMDKQSGGKAAETYDKAVEQQKAIIKNSMDKIIYQMSYHSAHRSNSYYWSMGEDRYAQINDLLGTNVHSLQDLYTLTPEQMSKIRDNLFDVWDEITTTGKYDKSEYWEQYADLAGSLDELNEKFNENLMHTSFDSFRDNFKSTLMDMSTDFSDFADDIPKLFQEAMMNYWIGDEMEANLKGLYDRMQATMKAQQGKLTNQQIKDFQKEYNGYVQQTLEQRNQFSQVTGYTGNESQKATANGVSSITYEQGSNIVALTTAGNISRDQMKDIATNKLSSIDVSMTGLQNLAKERNAMVDDMREIQANSYIELQGIHEDTTAMNKAIKDMGENIADIKKHIKDM